MKDLNMIKFLLLLLLIDKITNFNLESTLQSSLHNSKVSLDDVIEYLSESEDKKIINKKILLTIQK